MEYKIDLSKLALVELKDRVKGNWYVVANFIDDNSTVAIRRWYSDNTAMLQNGNQDSCAWSKWFEIPPNLPGFPKAELPDELILKGDEWEYMYPTGDYVKISSGIKARRIKEKTAETLILPPSSLEDRKSRLEAELLKVKSLLGK